VFKKLSVYVMNRQRSSSQDYL